MMVPEKPLLIAIGIVIIMILALYAHHRRVLRSVPREYYGDERAPVRVPEEDAFTTEIRMARAARYDTRSLAELASACPACGDNHPGMCAALEEYEQDMADEDVLTGTIVAVDDVPAGPVSDTDTLFIGDDSRIGAIMWEIEREWHQDKTGQWQAPTLRVDSLPEDDWLRRLLEEPVLALAGAV